MATIPPLMVNTIKEPNAPLELKEAISTQYMGPIKKGPAPPNPATNRAIVIPVEVRHVKIKIQANCNFKERLIFCLNSKVM